MKKRKQRLICGQIDEAQRELKVFLETGQWRVVSQPDSIGIKTCHEMPQLGQRTLPDGTIIKTLMWVLIEEIPDDD